MSDSDILKPEEFPDVGFHLPRPQESFGIEIRSRGQWYHHGRPIQRLRLCRLFAGALHRRAGCDSAQYWLITPTECGRVPVYDFPFYIVDIRWEPPAEPLGISCVRVRTSLGSEYRLSAPITVQEVHQTQYLCAEIDSRRGLQGYFSVPCCHWLLNPENGLYDTQQEGFVVPPCPDVASTTVRLT